MKSTRRQFLRRASALPPLLAGGSALATSMPASAAAATHSDVVVIGGGLSGLYTALLLKDSGATVTVLEGHQRIGGRVFTARHVENAPEFGASQIGRSYARTIHLCKRFGLNLIPEDRDLLPMASRIGDTWVNAADWADSPANRLHGEERDIAPALIASRLTEKYNRLEKLDDWLRPEFADLDISAYDLLKQHGHSDEAIRLANVTASGRDIYSYSSLAIMQERLRGRFDANYGGTNYGDKADRPYGNENIRGKEGELAMISNIEGGTSRLPESMAEALGDAVHLGAVVRGIDLSGDRATVDCLDGRRFTADSVVSALPFSSLRRVLIHPNPVGPQAEAIQTLDYADTTRAFGTILEPFWDDGIDPSFFTDGTIDMFWALKKRAGDSLHRFMVVFTGASASQMDQLPTQAAINLIEQELYRIRPAMKNRIVIHGLFGWGNAPLFYGCRHMFGPGQITRFGREMIQPFRNLHFAGEHTRRVEFGMEAALESGERVASEILLKQAV